MDTPAPQGRRSRRGFAASTIALAGILVGCVDPDRSTSADDVRDVLRDLPVVSSADAYYNAQSWESSESARFIVTVDPTHGATDTCSVVRKFIESFDATDIDPSNVTLEIRDTGPLPLPWSFTVSPEADAETAGAQCVTSQEVRDVPVAYGSAATASQSSETKPRMDLRFRSGEGIETVEEGEALAREHMPSFDDFRWNVLIICGDSVCDSGRD